MNRDPEYRPPPMSLAQRAALRSQQPYPAHRYRSRRPHIFLLIAILVILAVVVVVGGFEFLYRDRVYPNVRVAVAGVNVGGQTQAAAMAQLRPFSLAQTFRPVSLLPPHGAPMLVAAHVLGYRFNGGLTAWRAYTVGRTGNVLRRARDQLSALLHGTAVPPAQSVDTGVLHSYLLTLAHKLYRAPHNGVPGRRLDVASVQRRISRMLLHAGGFTVHLSFTKIKGR